METRRTFTFCRLCLSHAEVLMDIFQEDDRLYTAAEVIVDLLQLQVMENDFYSKFVCLSCFNKLAAFKKFKEQCMESKDTFEKEYLSVTSTNDPTSCNGTSNAVPKRLKQEESKDLDIRASAMPSAGSQSAVTQDDEERENIVVEVDVYPQVRDLSVPKRLTNDESQESSAHLSAVVQTVKDRTRAPPIVEEGLDDGESTSTSPLASKRPRKLKPMKLDTSLKTHAEGAKVLTRLETWQELLSRTGINVTSCSIGGAQVVSSSGEKPTGGRCDASIESENSVDYWRRRMQNNNNAMGHGGLAGGGLDGSSPANWCVVVKEEGIVGAEGKKGGAEDGVTSDEECSRTPPPGGKIHKCEICGRVFTRSSSLFRHRRIHTGEKPFICAECGKTFTQSGYLMQHMRVHSGDRRFACEECGKMFTDSGNLIQHRRVHTGEKPYGCYVCGMSFTQNGHLARHIKVHSGERPFECEECGKKFTNCSNLSRHVKLHAEGRI